MRLKRKYVILTFATTEAALAVEAACAEHGWPGRLIPTPQSVSAGCGLAWRAPADEAAELLAHVDSLPVERVSTAEM